MKKLTLILGTLALTTAFAFAHGGWGGYGMMGQGYGGYGPGGCFGAYNQNGDFKQLTEEEAIKKVQDVLKENFKGYEIVNTEKFKMPMGTMFEVEVKDAAGNEFEFHVNPFGYVMGPFVER
ncbi:MAG: hypothetical protein PWQ25_368 [Deferribacteres bacterium]|jgi:hypothetical protein|nr:hypothetical protein [Deferribacteres bacterium]